MRCTVYTCATSDMFLVFWIWRWQSIHWSLVQCCWTATLVSASLLSLRISLSCWHGAHMAGKSKKFMHGYCGKNKVWKITVDYCVNFICYKSRWGLFTQTNEHVSWNMLLISKWKYIERQWYRDMILCQDWSILWLYVIIQSAKTSIVSFVIGYYTTPLN